MQLKPIKIGKLIISPKKFLALLGAIFIVGIGIGVTVASKNNSKFPIIFCTIIAVAIIATTFFRKNSL
ncbi:hypothetical protein [Hyunsoonleella flava]|uniref:hypothetical protein n=1 Tax=Hyunsoonleella flava TaxID=2527939 RepID=UPI001034FF1F|nr:hypothetical protein [Hyunsoonleella flava]